MNYRRFVVAVALILAGITVAAVVAEYRSTRVIQLLQPSDHRFLASRLTDFSYAPYRTLRSAAAQELDSAAAAVELRADLKKERSSRNLSRLAHAEVALGHVQSAFNLLKEASQAEPGNASILSDLAGVQLGLDEPADAAETAARALEHDGTLAPAVFNWALALEDLANYPAATAAWQRYLLFDSKDGWATEARDHLTQLKRPKLDWEGERERLRHSHDAKTVSVALTHFPQRIRQWIADEVLAAWVTNHRKEDLELARAVADTRAANGDPYLLDVLTRLGGDENTARAVEAFASGRRLLLKRDVEAASDQLLSASEMLERMDSPLRLTAETSLASIDYYRGENESALQRLAAIEVPARKYPSMASEIDWVRGLVLYREGKPNGSLVAYRRAASNAARAHEIDAEIAIGSLISGLLDTIADPQEADTYRTGVLRRLSEIGSPAQRTYITYSQAAYAQLRGNRPRVALSFVESQNSIAADEERQKGDTLLLAETEGERALALRDLARPQLASAAIARAKSFASSVKTEGLRGRVLSDIDYIEGSLELPRDPQLALSSFSSSLAICDRYQWRNRAAYGYLARGETRVILRDRRGAEEDFRNGIAMMEEQRQTIDEPALRVAYFERSDRLFSVLCKLLLDERRPDDALDVAERKRARELLDRLASEKSAISTAAAPLRSNEISARLKNGTLLLEFELMSDGIAVWAIRTGQVDFAWTRVPRREIESLANSLVASVTADDEQALRRAGRRLYDLLLSPVKNAIEQATAVVIVPDGMLNTVPFACLVVPDGHFLVEQKVIASASSASTFVRAAAPLRPKNLSILAVAAPAGSNGLAYLPRASQEADEVSRGYRQATVLSTRDITPETFLNQAGRADIVHFAGHADLDLTHPARSSLLFRSSGDDQPAKLDVAAIAAAHFEHDPIVVLAACRTGSGKLLSNEGVASLATAFLRAGARTVVASLWDLDDESSLHLFRSLHAQLQRGASCAGALQKAQSQMLHSTNAADRRPSAWAGVVSIGAI